MQDLDALAAEITTAIESVSSLEALEAIRIDVLGKKGRVSLMMRELGGMDPEARKQAGQSRGLGLLADAVPAAACSGG